MSRKQINVRLSDEEYAELEKLAKTHNKSKSEIVRTGFKGELAKIDSKKNKSLSDEERKEMLVMLGTIMTYMSKVERHTAGVGRNVNQIAKMVNQGKFNDSVVRYLSEMDGFLKYSGDVRENMEAMSRELNKIWHTLV